MANPADYMSRCLQLAQLGGGNTAPNPMVGAVLVHKDRIIGEGYHEKYGGPHAEVNCLASVKAKDRELISESTLYVSLEPCSHFGKTPPCSDLIIKEKIPNVVVGCRDPFPEVDGKGIEKLMAAGTGIRTDIMPEECIETNKRFLTFHTKKRPYIVLKWAETADGIIGTGTDRRLQISNDYSNRLVHKWRSEEAAILIGTNTALQDNPQLTNRYWSGKQPIPLVIDRNLRLPHTLELFRNPDTIIINDERDGKNDGIRYVRIEKQAPLIPQLTAALYQLNIISVLVEGGATLLQSFLDAGIWDEARVISNDQYIGGKGINAPDFWRPDAKESFMLLNDKINIYQNQPFQ